MVRGDRADLRRQRRAAAVVHLIRVQLRAQAMRLCILSIVLSLAALMASEFLLRRATVRAAGLDA